MQFAYLSEMTVKTTRNLVLLIISLVHYWLGHVKDKIKDAVARWMPYNLDFIPLQVWNPVEEKGKKTNREGKIYQMQYLGCVATEEA